LAQEAANQNDCSQYYVGCFDSIQIEAVEGEVSKRALIEFPPDIFSYEGMEIETCIIYCAQSIQHNKYAALKNG
jgi:hypothetical protein